LGLEIDDLVNPVFATEKEGAAVLLLEKPIRHAFRRYVSLHRLFSRLYIFRLQEVGRQVQEFILTVSAQSTKLTVSADNAVFSPIE